MKAARWLLPMVTSLAVAAALLIATGIVPVRIVFQNEVAEARGLLDSTSSPKATPAAGPFWRDGSTAAPAEAPGGAPGSFAELTERVAPAVVSIQAERTIRPEANRRRSPIEEFFGFPFRNQPVAGEGSGFVISADGYVVTNNHVIADFDKIDVVFLDGAKLPAKVIGRDPATDVALLKVESSRSLPSLPLGDSDRTRPGDWVVAIGNPFGLENTVTAGIVSAKHRRTGQNEGGPRYADFIQTDAAINPGNSGGPLLNLSGEVIGINTMILSPGTGSPFASGMAGNVGIGLAIPVNMAKQVLPQLRAKGRVSRGKLGVAIQPVDPDAAELLGLDSAKGALVYNVEEGSPAARAGIKRGDVIVEFNGVAIKEMEELPQLVASTPIGQRSKVVVVRKGKRQTLDVTVGALALEDEDTGPPLPGGEEPVPTGEYGLSVQTLTPEIAAELRLDESVKGVVVSRVRPGSPAEAARLQPYDIILEVNQEPTPTAAAFKKAVEKNPKGALLLVRRGRQELFVTMKRGAS
jgi:serine protease Do